MGSVTTPLDHPGAVTRTIESTQRAGTPARVLVATRSYPAPPEDLWAALTEPDRIARWFLPVSGDLRLGGRYQLEGNAGGTVESCDPPTGFAVTWEYDGDVTWVSVTLAPDGVRTTLELRHTAHVTDERWTQFGPGAVGSAGSSVSSVSPCTWRPASTTTRPSSPCGPPPRTAWPS